MAIVGLQTDDTLIIGDKKFAALEEEKLKEAGFKHKDREVLTPDHPLQFNGSLISMGEDFLTLTQERHCLNLGQVTQEPQDSKSIKGEIKKKNLDATEQYKSQRARGSYVASVCQPEAVFALSVAAQAMQPDENDIKALNEAIKRQKENPKRGLKFVKLDDKSLRLLIFTDASFANNKDLSSQIGYIIVLADSKGNANIIHWSSIKCKRVTRSVLASELYALVHGFDIGAALKATIELALGKQIPLILCTDSKSVYDCLIKLGTTQEKRLMIDIMCLRQSYENREIAEVKWIEGKTNPADSMTKKKPSTALKDLLDTNKVQLKVVEWVEREGIQTST